MKPQTIGRVLGIGLRVAGRMAGQRIAGPAPQAMRRPVTIDAASGRAVGQTTVNVARGVGGFLRPFRRVGHSVFLEVVGVFFFLFVIVFGNWAWRLRGQAAHGPDHARFLTYTFMALVFLYLSVSSFWRARRKT